MVSNTLEISRSARPAPRGVARSAAGALALLLALGATSALGGSGAVEAGKKYGPSIGRQAPAGTTLGALDRR